MKNKTLWTAALVVALGMAGSASAVTTTINIGPGDVPDGQAPFIFGEAPLSPGLGSDSWQNNGAGTTSSDKVNWHARYLADGDFLSALFGTQAATIRVRDIASLSYWTKRPGGTTVGQDWSMFIYTREQNDGNDDASWYDHRFVNDSNTHNNIGSWVNHSTDTGMQFRRNSGTPSGLMSLAGVQAGYGDELVEMISVQTFSNFTDFNGYMDGLTITLTNGDVGIVNFGAAPIPEPATMTLLGLGLAGLGLRSRKRKNA